jgi:2-dehydro-3-deoxygalactonokinase
MSQTALIGVDWGTSNVRGFRYGAQGNVVETRQFGAGLKHVEAGTWATTFERHFGDWIKAAPAVPVLLSGMVGSRQGWCETPYIPCPAGFDELANQLHRIPGTQFSIVPGLTVDADGIPDVMRGEETQLAGLDQSESDVVCLPGTHTKWVQYDGGRISSFRTLMTGEMFDVLLNHSLLGRMASPGEFDEHAFLRGLECARGSARLLHDLFSVRTLRLFDRLPATSVAGYLSGLLIGHEMSNVIDSIPAGSTIIVVGSSDLTLRYAAAIQRWSRNVRFVAGETAAACGLWRIASQAKLVSARG